MSALPEGLVLEAAKCAGLPYVWGGTSLQDGADCSGFVEAVYAQRGVPFPGRMTAEGLRQFCTPIDWPNVQPGDLLFVMSPEDVGESLAADGYCATHVAISLGAGSGRVWSAQAPTLREVCIRGNPWWEPRLIGAGRHPQVPQTALPTTPDTAFSFDVFYPVVRLYADLYGADAAVLMGVALQESPNYGVTGSVVNRLAHDDGHGCGIFGLDDRYLLRDFEAWCGSIFVDGQVRSSIAPILQVEFVARWLAANTPVYGSSMNAARVWHTGAGGWTSGEGDLYEQLVRGHMASVGLS